MDLRPGHLAIVKKILATHVPGTEVVAFGSRVTGTAKEHSDLDLALRGTEKIDDGVLRNLRVAFEESDLPMRVDVVDWNRIGAKFRSIIELKFEVVARA